jgi:hypothetical protein
MKKFKFTLILILIINFINSSSAQVECPVPLGSSGGQQWALCDPAYQINYTNNTSCNLRVWWNYKTDCTDHMLTSGTIFANQTMQETVWEIRTDFQDCDEEIQPKCCPSNCTKPCYFIVEVPSGSQNYRFIINNTDFEALAAGGTYCGWAQDCGSSLMLCVTFQIVGPGIYNITFFTQ